MEEYTFTYVVGTAGTNHTVTVAFAERDNAEKYINDFGLKKVYVETVTMVVENWPTVYAVVERHLNDYTLVGVFGALPHALEATKDRIHTTIDILKVE